MYPAKILPRVIAIALIACVHAPAESQQVVYGAWVPVASQPTLQYRWSAQLNSDGSPRNCLIQVRGVDQSSGQFNGAFQFQDARGRTLERSLEVDLNPGKVVTASAGPACTGVTDVQLRERPKSHS